MNFKVGDRVEFIYRNKKGIGEINGVYPELREVTIKQSDSPVDLLFSDKAVAKVEEQERLVVPQCVADWVSHCKQRGYDLFWSIDCDDSDMPYEMYNWLTFSDENQELFARAWLVVDVGHFAITLYSETNEIEVIGNIHENLDLLEVAE
ncbi:DUF1642 domain-containing protein [Listeria monocytogenes]|nr:DUF1642 domain-containing protein [Listeria monocytogenes]